MDKQEAIEKFKKGEMSVYALSKYSEAHRDTVLRRLKNGEPPEEALRPPKQNDTGFYEEHRGGKLYLRKTSQDDRRYHHQIVAEEVLGKALPEDAVVHHVDGNGLNNENKNLVICQNQRYHLFLHSRKAAYYACGNANWKKCKFCKTWDDPTSDDLYIEPNVNSAHHRSCRREHNKTTNNQPGGVNERRREKRRLSRAS